MNQRINIAFLLSLIFILSGCNKDTTVKEHIFGAKKPAFTEPHETYHVHVNAINDGEIHTQQKYKLVPGLQSVSESSLLYKEYASYVHRAMKRAGYQRVNGNEKADIGVLFAYGIGEPIKETSYTTAGFATAIPSYYNYSAVATSTTKAKTVVTYTRNLILDAYDYSHFRKTGKEKQVWITQAVSTGARNDLRQIIPVLVTTVAPYIGGDTGKSIKLVVDVPSVELYEIMGKPIPPIK